MPRDAWSAGHASASCASSTAGPAPMRCSRPVATSPCSPDRRCLPASRHRLDDARPERPSWSFPTAEIDHNADAVIVKMPESIAAPLKQTNSLPHANSPDSRERSGLAAECADVERPRGRASSSVPASGVTAPRIRPRRRRPSPNPPTSPPLYLCAAPNCDGPPTGEPIRGPSPGLGTA
jgi:hypothetical protein